MEKQVWPIATTTAKLLCAVVLIPALSLYTWGQPMTIRIYTAKDGLPSSYVYGASPDNLGYLWVGSPEGLSRFDGKSFITYGLSDGLPDIRVAGMMMDRSNRYWAITRRGAVEFKGEKFVGYPFIDEGKINWFTPVFETRQGEIWTLTSSGIYVFKADKWEKIQLYPGYENHACRNIIDTDDGLYLNYGNLLVLKRKDGTYKIIGPYKDPGYYYNSLTKSGDEIFISTPDGLFEIKDQKMERLPGELGKLKDLYTYFRDSKKRFWIGRFNVGIQISEAGDSFQLKTLYKGPVNFLPQNTNEDSLGNIWVGSGNGLIKITESGLKIFDLTAVIGNNVLRNVIQPPGGPLFINDGTLSEKIFEDGSFSDRKLINGGITPLPNNELIIDHYAFDNKGRKWYYLRGFALAMQAGNKIQEQSKKFAHLSDQAFDVLFDSFRKKILVAVRTQKYPCQYNDTGYSRMPIKNNLAVQGNIMHLHQCSNATILFSTDQGYVYSIDKSNTCKLQLNEFNSEGNIRTFYNDPSGDVWIIYNGRGIRRYVWKNDSLFFKNAINKSNGLTTDNVGSICFDNKNNLWVCTNSSVGVFSPKSNPYKLISFFNADDLQMDGAVDARMIKDNEGNIWYFSGRHLICFYPGKISYVTPAPSIIIEHIDLELQKTNWSAYADSLTGIFQLPLNLKLKYDKNTLGFYFKGISSSGTKDIKYSYILEGLDKAWSIPLENDFVSYTKLPPGPYLFKVKTKLPNTDWSKPAVFSFEIKNAFWQTWWFSAVCILGMAAIIYGMYQNRINQLNKLLAIRSKISRDLHDEIGSGLTSIHILSKVSQSNLDKDKEKSAVLMQKITEQSENMQQSISDIVWSIKPGNDKIENLVTRMREYLGQTAEPKNIIVEFSAGEEILNHSLAMRTREHVFLIFKEAINNAVKYSEAKKITVVLDRKNHHIHLSVADDGIGFDPHKTITSNGLKNMHERAKVLKGELHIQSSHLSGTLVQLNCPTT